MILLITSKDDVTTDFVVKKLAESDVKFHRLNTEDLIYNYQMNLDFTISSFKLFDKILHETIDLDNIKSVYFRRPKLPNLPNDQLSIGERNFFLTEINYIYEAVYSILEKAYWISPVYSIRQAENKTLQLQLAQKLGFEIPDSLISNRYDKLYDFISEHDNDCIIKPIKTGFIEEKENSKVIFTSEIDIATLQPYEHTFIYPTYLQKRINKKADIRATVVGSKIFGAAIYSQDTELTKIDWRKSSSIRIRHEQIELPKDIKEKCFLLVKSLGLRFGAIDLILTPDDHYIFLEINPNGQWAWIEKRLGYNISQTIVNLLVNKDA